MNTAFWRLVLLALGAWFLRAVGPAWCGAGALGTNLLGAVAIWAALSLTVPAWLAWVVGVGLFWDLATFSALGHHALVMGGVGVLVRTQRGWWVGASWGEQAVGSILAGVTFFTLDRFLHCLEVRSWVWPFSLNIALVLAGTINGLVAVILGAWLARGSEPARAKKRGGGL